MDPFFYIGVKYKARIELTKQGYGFFQAGRLLARANNDDIDALLVQTCEERGEGLPVALGDGSILAWITKFLESPLGKALISALIGALLGGV